MANSLNLNLEQGEAVQLKNNQIVYCQGGFGMWSFTNGTVLLLRIKKAIGYVFLDMMLNVL